VNQDRRLIGRELELAVMQDAFQRGSGLVLVVGEAGIGKTRLVSEALKGAHSQGRATFAVGCLPMAEKLALLPLAELLRELDRDSSFFSLQEVLARLPRYVRDELGRVLPTISPSEPLRVDRPSAATDRQRLFSAVVELLTDVSDHFGLVLVIEDIHWADDLTLDMLTYLRAATRKHNLTLVATCRNDEVELSLGVQNWLRYARTTSAYELILAPLTPAEVARQAANYVGAPVSESLLSELYERAEGNAFLTEQLLASAVAAVKRGGPLLLPQALPGGLIEMLTSRARSVSFDGRDALAALAVAGRPTSDRVLADVTQFDDLRLRSVLRELMGAGLLAPSSAQDGYRPRHALLAEAVSASLLPAERTSLHEKIARSLERCDDVALAAEIAGHWASAVRPMEELKWSVSAAETAGRVYDFKQAAHMWKRAIELYLELPEASEAISTDLATIHVRAIDALAASGESDEAMRLAEVSYARFQSVTDTLVAAQINLRAARFRKIDSPSSARPLFERALDLFSQLLPSADYADALASYGELCSNEGKIERAEGQLELGIHIASVAGAPASQVRLSVLLAHTRFLRGDLEGGFAKLDEARELADDIDDVDPALRLAVYESDALLKLDELHKSRQVACAGLDRGRRGGMGATIYAALLVNNASEASVELGETHYAMSLLEPFAHDAPGLNNWVLHIAQADVDMRQGQIDAAFDRLGRLNELSLGGNPEFDREIAKRSAEILLWRREPQRALETVEHTLVRCEGTQQEPFCGEILTLGLRAAADMADYSRAIGDRLGDRHAREAADRLTGALDRMTGVPFKPYVFYSRIPVDHAGWHAEADRLAGRSDPDAWAGVAASWFEMARPHRAAYAWWRSAEAQLAAGGSARDVADRLRAAAFASTEMVPLLKAITRLGERARIPLNEYAIEPAHAIEGNGRELHGLTERELQVLRLVARGFTNSQIGGELFISRATAGVHVTNILRKLNVSNRTQAASLAERIGLLDESG
jgi:ATP/maltotriose-dependent transcriptional regulator MalT